MTSCCPGHGLGFGRLSATLAECSARLCGANAGRAPDGALAAAVVQLLLYFRMRVGIARAGDPASGVIVDRARLIGRHAPE